MRKFLLATLLALLAAPLAYAQSAGYRIQPGDQLAVTVLEDDTLDRQVLVLPDGRISVPLAGSVRAAGQTVESVESAIADRLASNFAVRPSVFVSVTGVAEEGPTFPIYVIGQVNAPGQVEVEAGTTLLQAIALSGGLDRFAATKRIQLRRTDLDRAGAALPLQLQRRRARRRHPVHDHDARGRRDRRSRASPLRVRGRCSAPLSPP